MKSISIISVLLLFMGLFVMGQSTIYTPWGTPVTVAVQADMTPIQRNNWDIYYISLCPNARFLPTLFGDKLYRYPSSTSTFNCHGYAWYMFWLGSANEFNTPYIMNSSEAENYFDDPSFEECSEAEADIFWINNGAHTALTTNDSDTLLSKWGTGPLAIHGKGSLDSPWPPTAPNTVTYYKLCYQEYTINFNVDETRNECAAQYENSSISNYVDLDIEYEKAVRFIGTFSTGTGSTLYIHPD